MKKFIILTITVLTAAVTLLTTGCSAIFHTTELGDIVIKTYDFTGYTSVQLSDDFYYNISQSDTYSVSVSTYSNLVGHLDIHQSGNTLFVGMKHILSIGISKNLSITITMPQLNKLVVSGDCKGSATGFISNNDLDLNLSGASRLDADLQAGTTKLNISGDSKINGDLTSADTQIELSGDSDLNMTMKTGRIGITASGDSEVRGSLQALDCRITLLGASTCTLTGSCGNTVIAGSGESNVNSPELIALSADVTLTGASRTSIYTDGTLNIDINGDSTLNYSGSPSIGKILISGDSKVNHK